jgi:hypothetical protein
MKRKPYTANIKGYNWNFYAESGATYARKHGNDSNAIAYFKDREVFFNLPSVNPINVRHEIMHCYVSSSSTNSSYLTRDQMEELCAEMYGEHGPEMDLLVDKLLEHFLK